MGRRLFFVLTTCATIFSIVLSFNSKNDESSRTITVGYLTGSERRSGNKGYPRPGLTISGAITLAVEEVNLYYPLRKGYKLSFTIAETYGEETESILQTALLWTQNISAYIGPQETCVHEARMAASFNLPMISYFCAHYETSNKFLFPTFARTRPPDTQISKSVASLLIAFKWYKVALLYSATPDRDFHGVAKIINKTIQDNGIQVRFSGFWPETYHYGYGDNPFDTLVQQSYREARIYVILGYYFEHLGLMVSMQKMGLFDNGEYFVVGVDTEQYDSQNPSRYLKGLLRDEIEDIAKKAFQSYVGVVGSPPVGFEDFTVKVNKYMQLPPFNFPNPVGRLGGMKRVPAEGAYLYDAIKVYARALNECLAHEEYPDGFNLFKYIKGRPYKSAMGYMVNMNENGDAEGNYTLIARQPMPRVPGEYGLYPVGVFLLPENISAMPALKFLHQIQWVGKGPPNDEPDCGFHNEKCAMWKVATGATGGVALLLLIIILVVYRNWAYEQELDSLLWKIDYKDIQINEFTPTVTMGKINRNLHPLIRSSQVSLSSNPEADFRYSTIYTQTGVYKGRILAIKRVKKKSIDITRKMKKELKMIRDLRHDNINSFIGACVDPPNLCIITDYCSRGSLKDILENEDVKLDNMFVASLIADILRGMIYLHDSSIRSHGNLKSTNCLVDSRWVVKIADCRLYELKNGGDLDDNLDFEMQCKKLLWKAPELLRDPNIPTNGTQKGDVYSFGIILYETVGRNGPYGKIEVTAAEIIKRVMKKEKNSPPFRPPLELLENPFDCVRECLRECWAEDPEDRPDLKTVRTKLRPMRKGMKPNIFDNMIAMMEKYANNLEALVDERTDQLIEEKKKTDALLYEMLPKYVADQLKKGNKVEAESFDCVTIYFSDIVGFTSMSAQSSPLQVVDFLNDLYTCFDSIIENYDVYKVETIGDAYMVVSGLPIRNKDAHAGEIASMALHLLDAINKFHIRHRQGETLMLRIGIHSGPVCAGVVGLKMPRYCLFGDTVNTASRMESTGQPLRVHCSLACKQILDKLGGYHLEERGVIPIKGKGEMVTYWLTGQDKELRKRERKKSRAMNDLSGSTIFDQNFGRSRIKHSSSVYCYDRKMSVESSKKLRFASMDKVDLQSEISDKSWYFDHMNPSQEGKSEFQRSYASSSSSLLFKRNSCPCLETCQEYSQENANCHTISASSDEREKISDTPLLADLENRTKCYPLFSKFAPDALADKVISNKRWLKYDKFKVNLGQSESEPFLPKLASETEHSV